MRLPMLLLALAACDTAVEQPAECAAWVDCIDARDAQLGVATDNDRFLAGGPCWDNPEVGTLCHDACIAGLDQLRAVYDDLPEECL